MPRAIHIDRGKEFVNDELQKWCKQNGLEIQMTAPYSPSQNGVAERMNCTLVELARAMIKGCPEFLWEYAIAHSSYIRNRSYTTSLQNKTPYEIRFNHKPNVSHFREFGSPVWVLLQGLKQPRKMEPKSRRRMFVGFDDGSKSIKYYNAETRRVLTSRNFRFLSLTSDEPPPEPIGIAPSLPGEGESEEGTQPRQDARPINGNNSCLYKGKTSDSTLPKGNDNTQPEGTISDSTSSKKNDDSTQPTGTASDSLKRKRNEEKYVPEKRVTRGIKKDYRYLQNPFPDEEEDINLETSSDEKQFAIIAGDELTNLEDAKKSSDWPEWEKAIQKELAQLQEMGTWKLIDKPKDAVPIANKWTFIKKRDKAGVVIK